MVVRGEAVADFIEQAYRFQASVGEAIQKHPNKMFYAFLLVSGVLVTPWGCFVLSCLLCSAYRRVYG